MALAGSLAPAASQPELWGLPPLEDMGLLPFLTAIQVMVEGHLPGQPVKAACGGRASQDTSVAGFQKGQS